MRWTPAQVLVSSMLGGPLAGFLLLALQARTPVGTPPLRVSAWVWVLVGGVMQLAVVLLGVFAPAGTPVGGITAAGVVVPWSFARQVAAGGAPEERQQRTSSPLGWGRTLALGVACFVATVMTGICLSVLRALGGK
jgi:hypothetical protein